MTSKHFLTALVIIIAIGAVNLYDSLAEVWQRESLIHKVGSDPYLGDAYPDKGGPKVEAGRSQQAPSSSDHSHHIGDQSGSSSYGYGSKPSDPSRKESSGHSNSPYSETIYGGVPTTPSADPLIKGLDREPSIR